MTTAHPSTTQQHTAALPAKNPKAAATVARKAPRTVITPEAVKMLDALPDPMEWCSAQYDAYGNLGGIQ
ncbi:hypothetical protein [Streptomyces noursei]